MAEVLLEFQRREELGPTIVGEIDSSVIESLGNLDKYEDRQKLYEKQRKYLDKFTPKTFKCLSYLAVVYSWHADPEVSKKALSEKSPKRYRASLLQDNIKTYFRLGTYLGTSVHRKGSLSSAGNYPVDIPGFWEESIKQINHDDATEIFKNLTESAHHSTWELTNFLGKVAINYAAPVRSTQSAVVMGAQSAYLLHSAASWHGSAMEHPAQGELSALVGQTEWEELNKLREQIRSTPGEIRNYKQLD